MVCILSLQFSVIQFLFEIFHLNFSNYVLRIAQMTIHSLVKKIECTSFMLLFIVVVFILQESFPYCFFVKQITFSNSQKVARISQTIYPGSKILLFVHYPRSIFIGKKISLIQNQISHLVVISYLCLSSWNDHSIFLRFL